MSARRRYLEGLLTDAHGLNGVRIVRGRVWNECWDIINRDNWDGYSTNITNRMDRLSKTRRFNSKKRNRYDTSFQKSKLQKNWKRRKPRKGNMRREKRFGGKVRR